MKNIAAAVLSFLALFISLSAKSEAATFNTSEALSSGAWVSLYMYLGSERYGRAMVPTTGDSLALDFPTRNCASYTATLFGKTSPIPDFTANIPTKSIELRVDGLPIETAHGVYSVTRGHSTVYLTFQFDAPQKVLNELISGSVVRLKVSVGDSPFYEVFSLFGSNIAIARAQRICNAHNPSNYFKKPKSPPKSQNNKVPL